jgi:oligopeptide/dipeptide ABC transporter ATP-binding protein
VLTIEDLAIEVPTDHGLVRAVDGVSLAIRAGEVTALVGESGSGKSLTALSILGLLPPGLRVAAGSIKLEGRELTGLRDRAYRAVRGAGIGIIFQEPMSALNPVQRVGAQVMEAIFVHERVSNAAAKDRVLGLFREVGIPEPEARLRAYPHELSGGLKQRVCIAMALAARPRVLIADEPTTALDVTVQAQVLALLQRLGHQQGLGVLLITHDLGVVAEVADYVDVMYLGRLVESAAVGPLFDRPLHPYTQGLFRSIPRLSERKERLEAIPGTVPSLTAVPAGCRFRTRCPLAAPDCAEEPPLQSRAGGRRVACFFAGDEAEPQPEPAGAAPQGSAS